MDHVIKFPYSRGGSGTLYHQSAIDGVMSCRGLLYAELPRISDIDVRVLRNGNLRIVSGQEWSSTKQNLLCAARVPGPS